MIVFDLSCHDGHRFEGWFGSSDDFASQKERGLLTCPHCGSEDVGKAPMAPAVPRKGNQAVSKAATDASVDIAGGAPSPEAAKALEKLSEMQAEALKSSKWVGDKFAEQSRQMHYGERDSETIHGKASPKEAKALADEGIPVAPLPFPVAPPDKLN